MPTQTAVALNAAFEEQGEGCVSPAVRVDALEKVLERYPDAPVVTLGGDGLIVPVPDTIPLRDNPILEGRAGLDLVEVDDESMAGWERILTRGAAVYQVHPSGRPEATWTIYGLDLRDTDDVIFMLAVPTASDSETRVDISEATTQFAVRAPRCATVRKDELAFIRAVDAATVNLLGWDGEAMVGRRSTDFIHPDDHVLARDAWMAMLADRGAGRRVRLRHRRSDGSWLWLEVTNQNLLADPDQRCVICQMVDISEEMAAHELLNRLAEAIPVGLLQLDGAAKVMYSNDRVHAILGVERSAEFEDQIANVAAHHQVLLREAIANALKDGMSADFEIELEHPGNGEQRFCTVGLRPLDGFGGEARGVIACIADISESIRMREELRRRSMCDELTACLNRPTILESLQQHICEGGDLATRAVMFVDLDRFKAVNDQHGHAAGDELLRTVAARLKGALRDGDLIGRMGGDEFLLVCPDIDSVAEAMSLAARLVPSQRQDAQLRDFDPVSISIGVAWSRGDELDADALVAAADEAMYASKRQGEGHPHFVGGAKAARQGEPRHTRRPSPAAL